MSIVDGITTALWLVAAVFFVAGTVGILRFPDVYTRLHALTKPDNVGLGFVVAGLALQAGQLAVVLKLLLIWLLVLASSSLSCQLIARSSWIRNIRPWRLR